MPGPLEPPDWTLEKYNLEPQYLEQEPSKKPLIVSPEDAERKYTDPDLIARVIYYVKKRTEEHDHEISEIKKLLKDIQSKIVDFELLLTQVDPPPSEEEEKHQPLLLNKVTRAEWGARKTDNWKNMELMTLPIKKVHITYSTDTKNHKNYVVVAGIVREIQLKHLHKGLPEIAHNFLIGGDGHVYEGRGWYFKPEIASQNPEWSDSTIDVAFIGKHHSESFPRELMDFTEDLMQLGIKSNTVSKDYEILLD